MPVHDIRAYTKDAIFAVPDKDKGAFIALCESNTLWQRQTPWGSYYNEPLFEIRDTTNKDEVRVNVGPYVGAFKIGDTEIRVNAPAWLRELTPARALYMLDIAVSAQPKYEFLTEYPVANDFSWEGFVEPVFLAFTQSLAASMKRGSHREYRRVKGLRQSLRGKIDWKRQFNLQLKGELKFAVNYSVFTQQNPLNALLSATCEIIEGQTSVPETFAAARHCRRDLGEQLIESRATPTLPRRASYLATAVNIATMIRRGMRISYLDDSFRGLEVTGYAINLFDLFEKYVFSALSQQSSSYRFQELVPLHAPGTGWTRASYPDITYRMHGLIAAVVDTKCKNITASGPGNPDLYQLFTYASIEGLDFAVIVYPVNSDSVRTSSYKMRLSRSEQVEIICYGLPVVFDLSGGDYFGYQQSIIDLHRFIESQVASRRPTMTTALPVASA
jgi:hypothetical protein